jgi:hypothetical protein
MEQFHALKDPPVEESPIRQSPMVLGRIVHIERGERSFGLI